jgi:hypothetical protein
VYREVEIQLHSFFISELDGPELPASFCGCFIPGKGAPRYVLNMRLVGPQNRYGRYGEQKGESPAVRLVA